MWRGGGQGEKWYGQKEIKLLKTPQIRMKGDTEEE